MRPSLANTTIVVTSVVLYVSGCESSDEVVDGIAAQRASVECGPTIEGTFPLMASLAVTMANELQRWEASTDLQLRSNQLELTQAAVQRCVELGLTDCSNVQAVLDFQNADPIIVDGEVLFNPTRYKQFLKFYYIWQSVMDHRPCRHPGASWCAEHDLTFDHSESRPCGYGSWYAIDARRGDRCGCSHGCNETDPTRILTKLTFAGYPQNGYLDPQFDLEGELPLIGIDPPLFSMIEGMPIPKIEDCYEAVAVYDPARALNGECCDVLGTRGTLTVSSWNDATLICE